MINISDIFICQRCGYCCQGHTTVSLDASDQKRMVAYLDLSRDEVARRYWRQTGNTIQMKTVAGLCIFYDDGCSIHGGKPWRCTQWPLHPSILDSKDNFEIIKESCPGIKREISYEEFREKFSQLLNLSENDED